MLPPAAGTTCAAAAGWHQLTPSHLAHSCYLQDLTYTVVNSQNKKEKIALLQNVGGFLRPGEMAALMGCAAAAAARLAAARAALHPAAMQQYPSRGRARICSGRY
jgi:hypothetical protein